MTNANRVKIMYEKKGLCIEKIHGSMEIFAILKKTGMGLGFFKNLPDRRLKKTAKRKIFQLTPYILYGKYFPHLHVVICNTSSCLKNSYNFN